MILSANRIIIGGTNSGCGKTTVTCGILKALKNRGINTSAFKVGPDYIDPMFHKIITGKKSRNLDSFLMGEQGVLSSFYNGSLGSDFSVAEGVMGYYDGIGSTEKASTAEIGNIIKAPAVLVLNAKGMALSAAAALKGFLELRENTVKGVILNNVKPVLKDYYKKIIEGELGLEVLGCLPFDEKLSIDSRHLGLVTADEINDINQKIERLGIICEKNISIDRLIEIGRESEAIEFNEIKIKKAFQDKIKIAVAYDKAFCFYYEDNFDILRKIGAELEFFSPLYDSALPEDISGIYIGGGYPELYLSILEKNTALIDEIKYSAKMGMPFFAECGGFMYLKENITDNGGRSYKMCSVIKGESHMTDKLSNFGYFELTAEKDSFILKKDEKINIHEFHYSKSDGDGDSFSAVKPFSEKKRKCIYTDNNIFGGYPHFNFYSNIDVPFNFLKKCREWKINENRKSGFNDKRA